MDPAQDVRPLEPDQAAALGLEGAQELTAAAVAYGRRARAASLTVGAWANAHAPGKDPARAAWMLEVAAALGVTGATLRRWMQGAARWNGDQAAAGVRVPEVGDRRRGSYR